MRLEVENLRVLISVLLEDMNDVDEFGMDAMTRRRLRVRDLFKNSVNKLSTSKKKHSKNVLKKKIPKRFPTSLMFKESGIRFRGYAYESKTFRSKGANPGEQDYVGYVITRFYNSVPDFDRSVVNVERRPKAFTITGSWPSSGKQVFDWELEAFGERGGSVVVKLNMWSNAGRQDGETFRTNIATVDKLIPKFVRKYYNPIKERMKKEAGVRLGRLI